MLLVRCCPEWQPGTHAAFHGPAHYCLSSPCADSSKVDCPAARARMHSLSAPQITRHAKREKRKENVVIPVLIVQIFQRPFQCWCRVLRRWAGHSGSLLWQCQPVLSLQLSPRSRAHIRAGTAPGAEQTSRNPTVQVGRGSRRLLSPHRAHELTGLKSAGALWLVRAPRDTSKPWLSHLWDCLAIQPSALALALHLQRSSRGAGGSLVEGEMGNK